jgi:glycerophosphoryl diester phosphodiesterase
MSFCSKVFFVILGSLISALAMSQPTFTLQGHRGSRGLMPENSLPAFLKAIDLGVSTLEMDVVISKDRQVVVSHEPYFHPDYCLRPDGSPFPKNEKTILYTLPYEEIKRYDCGSKGNVAFPEQQKMRVYKPLLSEVLATIEAYCRQKGVPAVCYNIEIKSDAGEYDHSQPQPAEFSDLVHEVIAKYLPAERVTLQSFDFAVLKHWKQQITAGTYAPVSLAALVANLKGIDTNLEALGFTPDIYSPYFRLLTTKKVARLHTKGMKVIPWTVNELKDMKAVVGMGVDGLITDYPNRYATLR